MNIGRLAIFTASMRLGGAERALATLATGLAGRNVPVDLVCAQAEGPLLTQVSRSVRIVDLGFNRVTASLPGLVRYIRRERPVALLSAQTHVNLIALWAKRLANVPLHLVISEHSTLSMNSINDPNSRGRLLPLLARWFYPWASSIVAVSSGVADDLSEKIGLPLQRIRVIYNPIDIRTIQEESQQPLSHPWFNPGDPPVILGLGRLAPEKDFATLVRAFIRIVNQRKARLLILGEGKQRKTLEELVGESGMTELISMPGLIPNPYPYLGKAAVTVLSSIWEGLPTVLIEALACGTPVVSTDCKSGPSEILDGGRYGRLIPVGDDAAMAEAILDTLTHPIDSAVLQARAEVFSEERSIDDYIRVLKLA